MRGLPAIAQHVGLLKQGMAGHMSEKIARFRDREAPSLAARFSRNRA